MQELDSIVEKLIEFRNERDWQQYHNSKDLAIAVSIEANELLELFLWKAPEDIDEQRLKEELADVLAFSLLLAHKHGFDISKILLDKIEANARKYPVDKAKGTAKKYDQL